MTDKQPQAQPVTLVPAPVLRQKAKKVTVFDAALKSLADSMLATMRSHRGMGLAAPQISQSKQLIVVEYVPEEKGEEPIPATVLVNPSITDSNKTTDWMDEGCLSIPGVELPVKRSTEVNVLAQDLEGKRIKIRAKQLFARILQHEIDHLNGVLITDRAYPDLEELAGKRIIFFGTPEHATYYLVALAATKATIAAVVTETDKPAGRKQILTAPPVKEQAEAMGIPVLQFDSLKSPEAQEAIKLLDADLAVVVAYGKIIPQAVLDLPKHGFLNIHYSLLPKYRGATPHQSAILASEKEAGYSIFKLDAGLDTGPILAQGKVKIEAHDSSYTLLHKMVGPSVATLLEVLPGYLKGSRKLKAQDSLQATETRTFTKEDGRIDWTKEPELIDRQIRGLFPWPGTFTEIDGQRLLIHAAHIVEDTLVIDVVQPAGKQPMSFTDYLRGNPAGLTFFSRIDKVKLN